MTARTLAAASGTFSLGGDLPIHRLGYGAMQITGPGVWGEPADRNEAIRVLRRAIELGVTLIDTADSYGPAVSEDLIREALHPYPADLVIATKGGFTRSGPGQWHEVGRPEYLRQCVEMSLRRLGVDRIDLYQLHRIDPTVPLADQLGALTQLQQDGKIRHLGLSEVTVAQIQQASVLAEVVSVQNLYNLADRSSDAVLDRCEELGIAFLPWFPLATGELAKGGRRGAGRALTRIAERLDATPAQVALAWLLARSPVMIPIPGTTSLTHLEENVAAAALPLSEEDYAELEEAA